MRPSVRATSLGCERARYEPGRHSGLSLMSLPSSTISRSSASFSAREPSTQWTRSGCVSAAISSTHATSAAMPVALHRRDARRTSAKQPGARAPESAGRVKMSASAMGSLLLDRWSDPCSSSTFAPFARTLPAHVARQELRFFRYHQGMPPTALELSTLGHRIRHQRVSHGLTLDELGERVGRRRQPAEPHRERQARAEAVAAAGDRRRDRRRGHRPALDRAAQPARRARDRARARAARLGVPAARHRARSRSPRA